MKKVLLSLLLGLLAFASAAQAQNIDALPVTDSTTQSIITTLSGKLPTAAVAADATANPTISKLGSYNFVFNGTTWDRMLGDATNGLKVQQAGTWTVTANAGTNLNTSALALDATLTGRLPAGGSPANGESNTNTALSRIGAYNFTFNGTTWDRWTGAVTQSGTWTIQPGNTANTTPWLFQIRDAAGNARGANVSAANALIVDGSAVTQPVSGTVSITANSAVNVAQVNGGTTSTVATGVQKVAIADSAGTAFLSAANALNSTGGGIQATQGTAQFDDVAPTAITENQFGNLRMSANRNAYTTIRDAAGNERGVNVSAGNALLVDASATTQPVSGTVTANAGTNLNTSLLQLDATGVKLNTAQGAAIASVTGPLTQTSTTTAAPTYTTATVNPLNTTTGGALRSDLTTIAGTAPTTAGKIDVKGADGDVFVRQATASNLNATVVQGTATNLKTQAEAYQGGAAVAAGNPLQVSLANTGANATAVKVDGSAVTQPVSGTVAATQSGTWTVQPGNTANTTPWLTSIVGSGFTAAVNASNQLAVNCANCSGSGVSQQDNTGFALGSGNMVPVGYTVADNMSSALANGTAGVARMSANRIAYADLSQTGTNQANNLNVTDQRLINAMTLALSNLHLSGSFNKTIGSVGDALKVAPLPASLDPCFLGKKGSVAISQIASTKLVSGQPGQLIYICYARVVAGAAEIPSFTEGTGAACATGATAVSGSTTAANGESYAANGGFSGGIGLGTISVTLKPGDDLCLAQSTSQRLSGVLTYVVAP